MIGPYLLLAEAWAQLPQVASRLTALSARLARIDIGPWLIGGLLAAGVVFLAMAALGHRLS